MSRFLKFLLSFIQRRFFFALTSFLKWWTQGWFTFQQELRLEKLLEEAKLKVLSSLLLEYWSRRRYSDLRQWHTPCLSYRRPFYVHSSSSRSLCLKLVLLTLIKELHILSLIRVFKHFNFLWFQVQKEFLPLKLLKIKSSKEWLDLSQYLLQTIKEIYLEFSLRQTISFKSLLKKEYRYRCIVSNYH